MSFEGNACPTCTSTEEEPIDYDVIGQEIYCCGLCGTVWSLSEEGEKQIINII